jgi:predicted porin
MHTFTPSTPSARRSRVLLLSALAAVAAPAAFAQSEVTLYGRVNLSLERQKAGNVTQNVLQDNSSRWGIRGSEDLGGGLKAGFKLESGFDASTGKGGSALFGRHSEVNLSGNFGMLRMGNMLSEAYLATADYISMHNHDTGTSADALYAFPTIRDTNKIAYRTPGIGGFTAEVATSLAEKKPGKSSYDVAANYDGGPLQLGAGYNKKDDATQFALRGLYSWGAFTGGAYVQRDKNAWASGNRTTTRLSGMYQIGATELHANWGRAGSYSNVPNSSANQYTLGMNYNLSKRTKVYAFYTKVADKGTIYGDFSSVAAGLRHNF